MSDADAPPPPLAGRSSSLYKQRSWSPDVFREEAWLRRKGSSKIRRPRSRSLTDDDLDELKACIELGFGFDSPEADLRLSDTLPALELYYAVNKQYSDGATKSAATSSPSSTVPHRHTPPHPPPPPPPPPAGSPRSNIFSRGDDPQVVKTRLRQWAQVVACSVRQSTC